MCCRWRRAWKSASAPDGRDLRNTMWRRKGPPEPPEPLTPSETGVLRWQAITQRLRRAFQQTPVLRGPSPHASPLTHTLEPYTPMYVSTAIRVIADYIHACLTHDFQTCVNPQPGFLTFGRKEDCAECRLLISSVVKMEEFFFSERTEFVFV